MSDINEAADRLLKAGVGGFARMKDLVAVCRATKCHDYLLAACERAAIVIQEQLDAGKFCTAFEADAISTVQQLDDAIAKAKGET